MSRGTPPSRILRWLALVLLGVVILVGPLVFSDAVARLASDGVATAQHSPAQVATLIIAALALDVFLPVPNGITNTLAGAVFGFSLGAAVIWTGLMAASLLGYAMGALAGKRLAQRILGADELARAHRFAEDLGPLVLILSRPVPVFAELATPAAHLNEAKGFCLRQDLFCLLQMRDVHHLPVQPNRPRPWMCRKSCNDPLRVLNLCRRGLKGCVDNLHLRRMDREPPGKTLRPRRTRR